MRLGAWLSVGMGLPAWLRGSAWISRQGVGFEKVIAIKNKTLVLF
jgi:hypothetical protein